MATQPRSDTATLKSFSLRTAPIVAQLLAGAIKHHTLYPEDHSIAKQHIKKIFTTITAFLDSCKVLRFDIGKNALLYDGEIAYQGKAEENDIAFLLGRDGVEWIEFSKNLELWEIQTLLRVINNNRRNDLDNDSSIATALWEQDFPHIEYKTIDLMAMDFPLLDISGFQVGSIEQPSAPQEDQSQVNNDARWGDYYSQEIEESETAAEEDEVLAETTQLAFADPKNSLWNLTELELFQLESMVHHEEMNIDAEGSIDILFILLLLQISDHEVTDILSFLQDRFLFCLQNHQFKNGLKIIRTLKKIASSDQERHLPLKPKITELLTIVSRPESLRDLEQILSQPPKDIAKNEMQSLWSLLQLLPPLLLKTLAVTSHSIHIKIYGPQFIALIEHFARQDSRYLAAVARDMEEKTCVLLFPILKKLQKEQRIPVLSSLSLHPSRLVRTKAFSLLKELNAINVYSLFSLIDDSDPAIKKTIVDLIGKQRDSKLERLLLRHLENHRTDHEDAHHIIACYHALGRVGSAESIPFLKDILLQGSKLGTLFAAGGGPHKEGAARALLDLRMPEARMIVKEGAANVLPDVRAACRKVLSARYG